MIRLFLCAALLTPAIPVHAQEAASSAIDAGDEGLTPVSYCVAREFQAGEFYAARSGGIEAGEAGGTEAGDVEAGASAPMAPPKKVSLAERHAMLSRVVRLIEFFRSPGADATLKRAFAQVTPPTQLKFFSSRRRVLNTMYRTLAVIDYTYAVKQPKACIGGAKDRHDMLYAKDGLFVDPKTGTFSPWLERLTGKKGGAVPTQASYEEVGAEDAARKTGASFEDSYQRAVDSQLKLSRKIDATKDPQEKAELMCSRAQGERILALAALRLKPSDKAVPVADFEASEDGVQASAEIDAGSEEPAPAGNDTDAGDLVTDAAWIQPSSSPVLSARELYKKTVAAVVAIRSTSPSSRGAMFGTGSVFSAFGTGQILTNAHVVWNKAAGKPYDSITVFFKPAKLTGDRALDLKDGIPAKVIRLSRSKDLALLELSRSPAKLQAIVFGDDTKVETGDPVFAIGHPEQGGLWTLTQGVVSAVKANLSGVKGKDAFQTDASINRGNSGGPLLDASGRQIGINTLIARRADDGLAITSVNFSLKIGFVKNWLAGPAGIEAGDEAADADAASIETGDDQAGDEQAGDGTILTVARPYNLDEIGDGEGIQVADDLAAAADETPAGNEEVADATPVADEAAAPEAKILTPQHPYDANALLQQQMKEMDDQGKEMSREIERRMKGAPDTGSATSTPAGDEVAYNDAGNAAPEAAGDGTDAGDLTESGAMGRTPPPAAVYRAPPARVAYPPRVAPRVVAPAPVRPAITTAPPRLPQSSGGRPGLQAPRPAIHRPEPIKGLIGMPHTTPIKPVVPGGCVNHGGGINVPKGGMLFAKKADKPKSKPGSTGGKGQGKPFSQGVKDEVKKNRACVFCGDKTTEKPGPKKTEIDHSIPKSRGGNNDITNAQTTCRDCNRAKGAKTSDEFTNSNNIPPRTSK